MDDMRRSTVQFSASHEAKMTSTLTTVLLITSLVISSTNCVTYDTFVNPQLNTARLYEHRHFRGPVLAIANLVGCFNFDRTSFNDRVSSIDTRGNCYFLYEDANCQGRWVRIGAHSEGDTDLAEVGFNDVSSSIRSCNFNPDPYGPSPSNTGQSK